MQAVLHKANNLMRKRVPNTDKAKKSEKIQGIKAQESA